MTTKRPEISVYLGDIHGARLAPLQHALSELGVVPDRLLCTMDLDQVLSMHELRDYESSFDVSEREALVVPGNHEDALLTGIAIDSGTFRERAQDTDIQTLAEDLNRIEHRSLRTYVETKLQIKGGLPFDLGEHELFPAVVIHGAFRGKEEKYLYEFPAELQTRIRDRGDMWLRLENAAHLRANFSAMRRSGVRTMIRGHDHFIALRSFAGNGRLYAHDVVINELGPEGPRQRTHSARRADGADAEVSAAGCEVSALGQREDFRWMPLDPRRRHVVNFGPYFGGSFGLVRSAWNGNPPAVAFCHVETTHYGAADRARLLGEVSLGARARAGVNFYDLFSRS